jgi:hypothetical protein
MGKLVDMAEEAIRKERARKAALRPAPPLPTSPATPIQDHMAAQTERLLWERIQNKLSCLSQIYAWIMEDEHLLRRVQLLEHRCTSAAEQHRTTDFHAAKVQYLTTLGELCEVYYLAHATWDVHELVSFRLKMRRVYLARTQEALDTHLPTLPAGAVCFLAREFPFLLVATPQQIEDIVTTKLAIPGAAFAAI